MSREVRKGREMETRKRRAKAMKRRNSPILAKKRAISCYRF